MIGSHLFLTRFAQRETTLLVATAAAIVVFTVLAPHFATLSNFQVIARNSVELLFIGLGMTLVLAIGGIDVSVGMVLGLIGILVGKMILGGYPPELAMAAALAAGAALGTVTGIVVVIGRIPAIVATIGLLGVYRAAIFLVLGGEWVSGVPDTLTRIVNAPVLGLPVVVWVIALLYLIAYLVLRHSPFGPHVLAIGNDEVKARLSGIAVRKVQIAVYVASGILCAFAAIAYVATYRNVETTIGATIALDVIVAVILGGTSILGGRASLFGTVIGVVLLRILQNGFVLVGIPSLWQTVVAGGLLLAVVASEGAFGRLSGYAQRRLA